MAARKAAHGEGGARLVWDAQAGGLTVAKSAPGIDKPRNRGAGRSARASRCYAEGCLARAASAGRALYAAGTCNLRDTCMRQGTSRALGERGRNACHAHVHIRHAGPFRRPPPTVMHTRLHAVSRSIAPVPHCWLCRALTLSGEANGWGAGTSGWGSGAGEGGPCAWHRHGLCRGLGPCPVRPGTGAATGAAVASNVLGNLRLPTSHCALKRTRNPRQCQRWPSCATCCSSIALSALEKGRAGAAAAAAARVCRR